MNRTEIEIKLNTDRAWLLETYASISPQDMDRGVTPSEHDPNTRWNAKDHLVHLADIEQLFNAMIRRHLAGDPNPVALVNNPDGSSKPLAEIMTGVHARNEEWTKRHQGQSFTDVVAMGQKARAETLALLAELSDEQLVEKLPGAPWADGTIGGVLAVNAGHGRMHYDWVKEAMAAQSPSST